MSLSNQILRPRGWLDAYDRVVLADKPVAYWKMNETYGTVLYDLSDHAQNLNIGARVALNQAALLQNGASMFFNGPIIIGTVPAFPQQASTATGATYECVVSAHATYGVILWLGNAFVGGRPSYYCPIIWVDGSGSLCLADTWSGTPSIVSSLDLLTAGPQHVIFTTDIAAGIASCYVQGKQLASVSSTATANIIWSDASNIAIGVGYCDGWSNTNGGLGHWNGSASHVSVYAKPFDASKAKTHYNALRTSPKYV